MADGLEAVQTTRRPRGQSDAEAVAAMAEEICERLQERFAKLKSVTGQVLDSGQWYFVANGPMKLACEARFAPKTKADRIYGAFYGWAEQNGSKLGVPKPKRRDEDEAA